MRSKSTSGSFKVPRAWLKRETYYPLKLLHLKLDCLRWPQDLATHLEAAGFQESKATHYAILPDMYAPFIQSHLLAAEEVSLKAIKNDAPEAQGPLFRKLLVEVYKENKTGVSIAHNVVVATCYKPL